MPGFDGTGPIGKGPFTGRGMGYCIENIDSKDNKNQKIREKEVFDMPGGDGTGPAGLGPMTGRAAGYCAGYLVPGYMNPIAGRGLGMGWGRGRVGFGRGGGRGRRNWYYATGLTGWQRAAYGYPAFGGAAPYYTPELSAKDEAAMLKDEAELLKQELKDVQNRISALEKAQAQEKK